MKIKLWHLSWKQKLLFCIALLFCFLFLSPTVTSLFDVLGGSISVLPAFLVSALLLYFFVLVLYAIINTKKTKCMKAVRGNLSYYRLKKIIKKQDFSEPLQLLGGENSECGRLFFSNDWIAIVSDGNLNDPYCIPKSAVKEVWILSGDLQKDGFIPEYNKYIFRFDTNNEFFLAGYIKPEDLKRAETLITEQLPNIKLSVVPYLKIPSQEQEMRLLVGRKNPVKIKLQPLKERRNGLCALFYLTFVFLFGAIAYYFDGKIKGALGYLLVVMLFLLLLFASLTPKNYKCMQKVKDKMSYKELKEIIGNEEFKKIIRLQEDNDKGRKYLLFSDAWMIMGSDSTIFDPYCFQKNAIKEIEILHLEREIDNVVISECDEFVFKFVMDKGDFITGYIKEDELEKAKEVLNEQFPGVKLTLVLPSEENDEELS